MIFAIGENHMLIVKNKKCDTSITNKKCDTSIRFPKSVTVDRINNSTYSTHLFLYDTIFSDKSYSEILNPVSHQLESLYDQFRLDYPDISEKKARHAFIKYVIAIETHLRMLIQYKINIVGRTMHVSLDTLRKSCPRITLAKNTKPLYAFDVFGKGKHMFSVLTEANYKEGKLTQIYMNKSYIDFLFQVNDPEAIRLYYKDVDLSKARWIPVHKISLDSFIRSTKNALKKPNLRKNLKKTLTNNLKSATRILNTAEHYKEEQNGLFMPHIENPSPYGRMYYSKLNLQQIHKEVRRAVLGPHYEYDLVAAVYAIRLLLVRRIFIAENETPQEEELFPLTSNYVKDRSTIRNDLKVCFKNTYDVEWVIKTVITSISFGANFEAHAYPDPYKDNAFIKPSLETLIKSDVDRANFVKHPWVIAFRKEQKQLTDFVFNYYKDDPRFLEQIKDVPAMYSPAANRLRKAKVTSYLFQTTEYEIMDNVTSNIDYLIRIHDGVLTRRKIFADEKQDINWRLKNDYAPYIQLEQSSVDGYFNISDEKQEDMDQHKQFIKEQERKAIEVNK